MAPLSVGWLPLCVTVFALGLRHGLDADHLAMIDGLIRFNSSTRPGQARWSGALFSAGHGVVVVLVATTIGFAATRHPIPGWARDFGAWVSVGFLVALGMMNLNLVFRTPVDELVRPAGLRSRFLSHLTQTTRPIGIAAIGALFAVSFDTLSQAVLFSATAARFGGWERALVLGSLFTLGMLIIDGVNGAWVAALLIRADRRTRIVSRATCLFVALLSFTVAAVAAIRYFNPRWDDNLDSRAAIVTALLVIGAALGTVLLSLTYRRHSCSAHTEPV